MKKHKGEWISRGTRHEFRVGTERFAAVQELQSGLFALSMSFSERPWMTASLAEAKTLAEKALFADYVHLTKLFGDETK